MPSIDTTNSPVSQPSSTTGTAQAAPVAAGAVTPAPLATQVATATPADGYRPPGGNFAQRELDRAAHHDTRVIGAGTDFVGNVEVRGEVRVQALDPRNDTDPQRNASGKEFLATTFNGKVVVGAQMIHAKKDVSFRAVLPTSIATEDSSFGRLVKAIAPAIRALPSDLKKLDADAPFTIAEAKRLPSGGEFSVKFTEELRLGPERGQTVGVGVLSASYGAGAVASVAREFARSVYKMPGTNIVYAEVGETSRNAFNVGANFRAGSDLSGAIGNQVDRIANIEGSIGAAIETRRPLTMGGVFNLDDPNQAAAYTHLMTTSPFKLKANQTAEMANLAAVGVGFDYAATQKAAGMNATLTAGRKNLLAVRSVSRSERGTLHLSTTDGSGNITSKELSESEYAKSVTGKIPMLVLGKNGNVDVRATQVENADGTSSLGASMAMGIDVRKLSTANVARIRNLFTDLGVDTSSVKTDGAIGGNAHLDIEFAMDSAFFTNLNALGDKKELELQARFDANYQDLNGEPAPWNNTVAFDTGYPSVEIDTVANLFATSKAAIGSGADEEMKRQARDSYNHSTRTAANPKGRSLDGDIKSFETRNRVAHAIGTASSGDAADWRPIMNAIGKTDQYDFMVIALMAHELGAPLVDFHLRGTGMDFSHSAPNVSARTPTIAEQVGLLTSRWNK